MKQKILFTGGSGLLAINWALTIADEYEVVNGLHLRNILMPGIATESIDLENSEAFAKDLERIRPDVVIHCAGLTSVEKCEADPALAKHINVDLSVNAAEACYRKNIRFVYICTDHLFAGDKGNLTEDEPVSPLNVYGKTKAEAENKIFAVSENFLSIRTNFYGWGNSYRHSFSDTIILSLRNRKTISLFDDVFYSPILISTLAKNVMKLISADAKGIYNVVGNQRISKHEFGIRIAEQFGLGKSFIETAKFMERKDLVQRPLDLSLSDKKATDLIGVDFGDINEDIHELFQQEQNGFSSIIQNI